MTGRWLAAVVTVVAVGGCNSIQGPGVLSLGGITLSGPAQPARQGDATRETLIATRLSDGSSGSFRRIAARDGVETWAAADGSAFSFRSGLLISTFALGHDLYSADVADVLAAVGDMRTGPVTRVHRYLDGESQISIRAFQCALSFGAASDVSGAAGPMRQVTELCESVEGGFQNEYLVAASDGAILQSTQWVGSEAGYVRFSRELPRSVQVTPPILVPATVIVPSREAP